MTPTSVRAMRAIAYTRVSTEEQETEGYSLDAQMARIKSECAIRGWMLMGRETDVASAKTLRRRPALARAMGALADGEADVLMVARLDRLSRSVGDFAGILETASSKGWQLVCLDPSVDTSTPYGKAMAQMASVFAELERALISQRTKEGLAAARAAGRWTPRGPEVSDEAVARILELKALGYSIRRTAVLLELEGFVPPRGGPAWDKKTVNAVLRRHEEARAA
jgi:DNA invertase Pin-like site-specific DNA recombinase